MTLRAYRTFQTLLLGSLGLFLLFKVYDGDVLLYINRRFIFLTLLAALGLMSIAQALLRAHPGENPGREAFSTHSHNGEPGDDDTKSWSATLWWMALPLAIGLLIPARPPGSAAAAIRGIAVGSGFTGRGGRQAALSKGVPAAQRSVLDWVNVFAETTDPATLTGQSVDITGFVYREPDHSDGRFIVARFMITCCVADAQAIGLEVHSPDGITPPVDSWVRVKGQVEMFPGEPFVRPVVEADEVMIIPEPQQPYLYP